MNTTRNYGIDALRILSMMMVVTLHILTNGGVLNSTKVFSSQYEMAWLLQIACFGAVNCYAIISGYVGVYAKYRYRNLVELWLRVLFYTISITVIFSIFFPGKVTWLDWIKAIFPGMLVQYWYFSSYIALFLFMPFLNNILNKMKKQQIESFLLLILIFSSGMQTVFYSNAFGMQGGYSALWLMILYLLGGYIRKYSVLKIRKKIYLLLGYIMIMILTWSSKLVIEKLTFLLFGKVRAGNYLISYISPTILLGSIFLVSFFQNIQIKGVIRKMVGLISPMTFSVYLIHNHPLVEEYMNKRFSVYASYSWWIEIFLVILTVIAINLLCYIIDGFREFLFRRFSLRQQLDKMETEIYIKLGSKK